jgi:hypothetical protein
VKTNYHYSGMSTPEAIEDFRSHFLSQLPRWARWLVDRGFLNPRLTIVCDGCGRQEIIEGNAKLLPSGMEGIGYWEGTDWTHRARLDFCEVCSHNGTAVKSVRAGVQPLGTYTFGK